MCSTHLWQYPADGRRARTHLDLSLCCSRRWSFIRILRAKSSPFSCVHFQVNQATKSERQIEAITSEGWCAPTMMLDHPISEASAIAPIPSQGRAKRITAAKPKAVAVCPEGNELNGGSPIVRRPSLQAHRNLAGFLGFRAVGCARWSRARHWRSRPAMRRGEHGGRKDANPFPLFQLPGDRDTDAPANISHGQSPNLRTPVLKRKSSVFFHPLPEFGRRLSHRFIEFERCPDCASRRAARTARTQAVAEDIFAPGLRSEAGSCTAIEESARGLTPSRLASHESWRALHLG